MRINKAFLLIIFNFIFLFISSCSISSFAQPVAQPIDITMFFNELQGQIGYSGTEINGKGQSIDELESKGMQNKESNALFSDGAMKKRQQKTEELGFDRNNKGFLDKALRRVKNAEREFDFLKSSNEVCTSTEEIVTDNIIEICDQYYQMEESSCFPKQIVEIDPKYNYLCNKKREVGIKTCTDSIKTIKCKDSAECDLGGIKPGSVESDIELKLENGVLTIGTIRDNGWEGKGCQLYDKNTTFKLKNVHLIKEFTIFNVGFDDYMEIIVNGTSVYAGPDDGRDLRVVTKTERKFSIKKGFYDVHYQMINNGSSDHPCERNTNWNLQKNIDLKPYLVEGENSIRIRVFVSGWGEGWLKIRAKQNCCSKWDIQREEKCAY